MESLSGKSPLAGSTNASVTGNKDDRFGGDGFAEDAFTKTRFEEDRFGEDRLTIEGSGGQVDVETDVKTGVKTSKVGQTAQGPLSLADALGTKFNGEGRHRGYGGNRTEGVMEGGTPRIDVQRHCRNTFLHLQSASPLSKLSQADLLTSFRAFSQNLRQKDITNTLPGIDHFASSNPFSTLTADATAPAKATDVSGSKRTETNSSLSSCDKDIRQSPERSEAQSKVEVDDMAMFIKTPDLKGVLEDEAWSESDPEPSTANSWGFAQQSDPTRRLGLASGTPDSIGGSMKRQAKSLGTIPGPGSSPIPGPIVGHLTARFLAEGSLSDLLLSQDPSRDEQPPKGFENHSARPQTSGTQARAPEHMLLERGPEDDALKHELGERIFQAQFLTAFFERSDAAAREKIAEWSRSADSHPTGGLGSRSELLAGAEANPFSAARSNSDGGSPQARAADYGTSVGAAGAGGKFAGASLHPHACKPCAFFWNKGCLNGDDCNFCHSWHPPKRKKPMKEQKNLMIVAKPEGRITFIRCTIDEVDGSSKNRHDRRHRLDLD